MSLIRRVYGRLRLSPSRTRKVSAIVLAVVAATAFGFPLIWKSVFAIQPTVTVNLFDKHGNRLAGATVQGFMERAMAGRGAAGLTEVFNGTTGPDGRLVVSDLAKTVAISKDWVSYQGSSAKDFSPRVLLFITYSDANGLVYFEEDSVPLITVDFLNQKSATVGHAMDLSRPIPNIKLPRLSSQQQTTTMRTPSEVGKDPNGPAPAPMDGLPNPNCNANPYCPGTPWWQYNFTNGPYPSSCCSHVPVAWGRVTGAAYALMAVNVISAQTADINTGYAIGTGYHLTSASYYPGATISSFQNQFAFGQGVNLKGPSYPCPSGITCYSTGEIWMQGQIEGDDWYQMACPINAPCGPTGLDLYQIGVPYMSVTNGIIDGSFDNNLPAYTGTLGFANDYYFTQVGGGFHSGDGSDTPTQKIYSYGLTAQFLGNQLQWYANMALVGLALVPWLPVTVLTDIGGIISNLVGPIGTLSTGDWSSWWQFDAPIGQTYDASAYLSNAAWQASGCSGSCYVPLEGYLADSFGPGSGGGCVLSGTSITLADGTQIPVDNIRIGQKLLSYNTQTGKLLTTTVYNNTAVHVSQIVEINGLLYASGLHDQPIYVQLQNGTKAWIQLGQLQNGMKLFQPVSGTWITITNIQDLSGSYTVFDLRTANAQINNYIANGVLMDKKL